MINAFTIDVEDYYQVSGFEAGVDRAVWCDFESRVTANTHRLLDLLDDHAVRATFFILGWVAEHHRQLVTEIQRRGHEIGSHSFWHRLVYRQTPAEFREDLRRSRDLLQDLTGTAVEAYRAPSFSITQRSQWALEILVEEGFRVDSSIVPLLHDRYGMPHAPRGPHCLQTPAGPLWEFPPTVARTAGVHLPVGGGGYFRLFPLAWTTFWLAQVQRRDQHPAMFYIHPWEVDPEQPRLSFGGRLARFRHYVHLDHTEAKLRRLLSRFHFDSLSMALAAHRAQARLAEAV
ncbi:MAG: DUF3473 domain-containing protein [Planctomycetales bacterium]|nr:DUF3473 domain-containing protein [Planctomycetales bacterium]